MHLFCSIQNGSFLPLISISTMKLCTFLPITSKLLSSLLSLLPIPSSSLNNHECLQQCVPLPGKEMNSFWKSPSSLFYSVPA